MSKCRAFTLIELLVVIGIITILIGLLIPAIHGVRVAAYNAATLSEISGLQAAIEQYYGDFHSYPGPLTQAQTNNAPVITGTTDGIPNINGVNLTCPALPAGTPASADPSQPDNNIQGTENLVLGLLGGLQYIPGPPARFIFDPAQVGKGAMSLNPNTPKRYSPYLDGSTRWLDDGLYLDRTNRPGGDTIIPEFVDRFPDAMPILYLRATPGATNVCGRNWATATFHPEYSNAQYDIDHISGYTGMIPPSGGGGPYAINLPPGVFHGIRYVDASDPTVAGVPITSNELDGTTYFTSQSVPGSPRAKDSYILISAGKDRVYGTSDDQTSFGSVR